MIDKLKQHWVGISFFLAVGFLIFRLFIADDKNPSVLTSPYANEIAAAFLGTLLTVIVTALLLEKTTESQRKLQEDLQTRTDQSQAKLLDQTDKRQAELAVQQAKLQGQLQVDLLNQTNKSQAELAIQQAKLQADLLEKTNESQAKLLERQALQEESKEKNLAIYEKKFEAYKSLMDALEEAMCEGQPKEAARNKLRFQAFRTRFIAHKIVVDKLNDFSAVYINLVKDNEFSEEDRDECSDAVNALVDAMRADLEADRTGIPLVATAVEANILKASTDSVSNGQSISTPSLIQQAQLTSGSSDFTPQDYERRVSCSM